MSLITVTVKWNRQVFSDVEVQLSMPVSAFKETLRGLTGVPLTRQKLMCRGAWKGMLKDEMDLAETGLAQGAEIKLMGTAETLEKPAEETKFVEDLSSAEQANMGTVTPAGFINLGNTCYMNSTLQCFREVPELRDSLQSYLQGAGVSQPGPSADFTRALGATYTQLDASTDAYPPAQFVRALRTIEPQFAQTGQRGHFLQQDAQEFFVALYRHLSNELRSAGQFAGGDISPAQNMMDALFGIEVEETMTNTEDESEEPVVKSDRLNMLVCNIQGGQGSNTKINHVSEGIAVGLESEVEKFSNTLNRNAIWKKTQRVKRLPKYLCLQFMRFFWKATPDSRDHPNGVKCKIMRTVNFPEVLDIFNFCANDLRARMKVHRDVEDEGILESKDAKPSGEEAAAAAAAADAPADAPQAAAAAAQDGGEAMDTEDEEDPELRAAMALSMNRPPAEAGIGLPEDFQGNYEIFGVVTHKGRDADSGHYIGWVRQGDSNKWLVFDDETVSEVNTEQIMQLSGGGDWHTAYLAFYRAKK